jgi:hypothetical protein
MIKLESSMYDNIKDEYINKILPKIQRRTNTKKYKESNPLKLFFGQIRVADFFKTNNKFDKEKLKDIIFADFENLLIKVDEKKDNPHIINLKNYFRTGCLIHFSNFDIEKELEKQGLKNTGENQAEFRRQFVRKYKNSWIDGYIYKYSNYSRSEKDFNYFIDRINYKFKELNKIINTVVNYSILKNTGEMNELRHKIITSSGISVCPYCDRQYITSFEDKGSNRTTADLDHFYPKSVFSLFALSLYNFIASCKVCNQSFKTNY